MPRLSRYNVVVGDGGERLLFNTASGAFSVLDAQAALRYDALEAREALPQMGGSCGPDGADDAFLQRLESEGFVTDESAAEELARLQEGFEAARHEHDALTVALVPTYSCNFRCPYCYEQDKTHLGGKMDARVEDAVARFVECRLAEHGFRDLSVQWYGGEPSLALGVLERLSKRFITLASAAGASYSAMILTNCGRIDSHVADLLVACRVQAALLTIDGFEETHNARRVSADGTNSFARVTGAARLFQERGIQVNAIMNVDKVNWPQYRPLRRRLREELGIELSCARLCDCGHFFGTGGFKAPAFELFEPDQFARLEHGEFAERARAKGGFDAGEIRELLSAPPRFCNGQRDDYYVIDCFADVYACDGYVGDKRHVRFNLFDLEAREGRYGEGCGEGGGEGWRTLVSHDPFADAQCRECKLLPICLGNCDWERRTDQMQCHPLKTTLPDYLRDLRKALAVTACWK